MPSLVHIILEIGVFCLIDFMDDFNNIEIIYHEKFTLEIFTKADITIIHFINSFIMLTGS